MSYIFDRLIAECAGGMSVDLAAKEAYRISQEIGIPVFVAVRITLLIGGLLITASGVLFIAASFIQRITAAEREWCAKIGDAEAEKAWAAYKGHGPETDTLKRADSYADGYSDGATAVAAAIRAWKEGA